MTAVDHTASTKVLLRALKLPSFRGCFEEVAGRAEREGWSFVQYLHHLAEMELQEREQRRIARYLQQSQLPASKTLTTLKLHKLPRKVRRILPRLCDGDFVDRATNVLAFGLPGRGKTNVLCAIGHELVRKGRRVLFTSAYALVQRLLAAKRDYELERELRRLDGFAAVLIDDLGYVQQDRAEMEVLFTFLGERYERRSVLISSNLVFSKWESIFKDPMTTAAAIDRLVHHSEILELTGRSYRAEEALQVTTTTTAPRITTAPTTTTASTTTTAPTTTTQSVGVDGHAAHTDQGVDYGQPSGLTTAGVDGHAAHTGTTVSREGKGDREGSSRTPDGTTTTGET